MRLTQGRLGTKLRLHLLTLASARVIAARDILQNLLLCNHCRIWKRAPGLWSLAKCCSDKYPFRSSERFFIESHEEVYYFSPVKPAVLIWRCDWRLQTFTFFLCCKPSCVQECSVTGCRFQRMTRSHKQENSPQVKWKEKTVLDMRSRGSAMMLRAPMPRKRKTGKV